MILLMNLLSSKSSHKNWSTIPDNLDDLARWEFRDVNFHICISIISCPSIQPADDSNRVESDKVEHTCVYDGIE